MTQAQYEAVVGANPSKFRGPNNPADQVSWTDAVEFCRLATEKTRRQFRLPTEAEWEYACRAGSTGEWHFGSDQESLREYAWYEKTSRARTREVGQKTPNAWDLYDMHGNVWEWVGDRYAADYYARSPREDPKGPAKGSRRLHRGGGWCNSAYTCRSAIRSHSSPSTRKSYWGFRAAVTAPLPGAVRRRAPGRAR